MYGDLGMKKGCAKVVPKILTPEQKEHRVNCCVDTLENIENDPDFFQNVILVTKLGFLNMIQRLRDNPCIGRAPNPLGRRKRAWASLNSKQWWLFFSISGGLSTLIGRLKVRLSIRFIIKMFWRPSVNVCDEGDQTCGRMPRILHHDNAPAHNALSVKRCLAKNKIPVMEHPPYSPDLAPCEFFLFPKIKSALKGTRFESVDAVKVKATQLLNSITQDDLQHCFQQWKILMERCRDRGGD